MYNVNADCQVKDLAGIYTKWFGEDKKDGYYVEVGACDGKVVSNTLCLVELGWKGLAVEPNPNNFYQLVRLMALNPNITCIPIAIGKEGIASLYLHWSISTTNPDQAALYRKIDWFQGNEQIIQIPMITLDELLKRYNAPIGFEVLVVDTEGNELEVLQNFDIDKWKPQMCIIEVSELHPTEGFAWQAKEINEYFDNHNYKRIYIDEINSIYIEGNLYASRG